jgi:hypothetical protein
MTTTKAFYSLLVLGVATALFALVGIPQLTRSQTAAGPIGGYAWSDTIGWIDLNCENLGDCTPAFGLSVDDDGNITGLAWSDNIGWVSARPSDLAGCPQSPCSARITSTGLEGWLRATSGNTAQSGGWDGFISLSGPDYGVTGTIATGFSGFGWGSIVVGWTEFALTALTPSASDACPNIPGTQASPPQNGSLVGGSCVCDPGFELQGDQCVPVGGPQCPQFFCAGPDRNGDGIAGDDLFENDAQCTGSFLQSCSYACSAGACLPAPAGSGNITATPSLVRSKETTRVQWTTVDVEPDSCSVTEDNPQITDVGSGENNSFITSPLEQRTTYTLACTGLNGDPFTDFVIVNVLPMFQEK